MAKKLQETLCAHAQRQEATAVSECKKLSRVQFSLHYTLCSFVLPLPFIYLYPFPHALTAEQQHHSFPSLSLSSFLYAEGGRKHPDCVPGSPLCMHSPTQKHLHKSEEEAELTISTCYYESSRLRVCR